MTRKIGASVAVVSSSLDHPKYKLKDTVKAHCFSHQLEVLLPKGDLSADILEKRLQLIPVGSFCLLQCRLHTFLQEPQILNSLSSSDSELRILSVQRSLDGEDTIAITASGQLHLHLSEATHQKFGLVGERSKQNRDLIHVHVDLTSKNFQSKGPYFHRVLQCLESCPSEFDFICSADEELTSDSISFCQLLPNAYQAESRQTAFPQLEKLQRSVRGGSEVKDNLSQAELQYALDSIGALSIGGHPEASVELGSGYLGRHIWTGLILPTQVEACLSAAAESIEEGKCLWAAVTIRGFKHAPVYWERREKSQTPSSRSGADYIVLLLPGKQYISFVLDDASDAF